MWHQPTSVKLQQVVMYTEKTSLKITCVVLYGFVNSLLSPKMAAPSGHKIQELGTSPKQSGTLCMWGVQSLRFLFSGCKIGGNVCITPGAPWWKTQSLL